MVGSSTVFFCDYLAGTTAAPRRAGSIQYSGLEEKEQAFPLSFTAYKRSRERASVSFTTLCSACTSTELLHTYNEEEPFK